MGDTAEVTNTVGSNIRRFRKEANLSLNQLADKANVSKGYLSALENDSSARRPSGEILYAIAEALGVTMSDLMGRRLLTTQDSNIPDELRAFAEAEGLPQSDIEMLASIQFRGERPKTQKRWAYIYEAIRMSSDYDKASTRSSRRPPSG